MASGTVKWFNSEKGFGFIAQDGGGPDVFAHYSNINASGHRELLEGRQVTFDIAQVQKGPRRKTSPRPDLSFSGSLHRPGAERCRVPAPGWQCAPP